MIEAVVEQSLPFLPLALAIYIGYCVLNIADLTTDGTFLVGAALFGIGVKAGLSQGVSLAIALSGGALGGAAVGILQTYLRIPGLIAGILLVFILSTLTLLLMGKPNLSLLACSSPFSIPVLLLTVLFIFGSVFLFLSSKTGLLLRALGSNGTLVALLGKNRSLYKILGLSLSNALTACSGGLTAAQNGYVDISMGTGVVLIALATVLIGNRIREALPPRLSEGQGTALVCTGVGVFVYFHLLNMLIRAGLDPVYLRLATGMSLILFLGFTHRKKVQEALS